MTTASRRRLDTRANWELCKPPEVKGRWRRMPPISEGLDAYVDQLVEGCAAKHDDTR